jgi:hypothetical protein
METCADDSGDPFTDRAVHVVVTALVLLALLSLGGTALIYYGDSFAIPSWNERSVPAPKLF